MLDLDIDNRCQAECIPSCQNFEDWATLALQQDISQQDIELSVLIVNRDEMHALNKQWREQDKATNILSFPANSAPVDGSLHLGDIIICADVVEDEAVQQDKISHAHWAHIFIHGMLHLQNYDHIDEAEAHIMESLEIELLAKLNIDNPYTENKQPLD